MSGMEDKRFWLLNDGSIGILFWDLPREEHAEWARSGCGTMSWTAYRKERTNTKRLAKAMGLYFVPVGLSVADMLEELADKRKANTEENRYVVLGLAVDEDWYFFKRFLRHGPNWEEKGW